MFQNVAVHVRKREEAHCYTEGKDAAGETLGISVLAEYSSWTIKKRKKKKREGGYRENRDLMTTTKSSER